MITIVAKGQRFSLHFFSTHDMRIELDHLLLRASATDSKAARLSLRKPEAALDTELRSSLVAYLAFRACSFLLRAREIDVFLAGLCLRPNTATVIAAVAIIAAILSVPSTSCEPDSV